MEKLGIVCLLSKEINLYHLALRQKIASQFGIDEIAHPKTPAHITIKYPFPVKTLADIEKSVQDFSLLYKKTAWQLQGFGFFKKKDGYVIFIDVIPSKEMRKTHINFLSQLREINWVQWGQFDNANLHYHVTLGAHGITSTNFDAIWSFLQQQEQPYFNLYFDNLSLVKITEESRSIYRTYWFQNQRTSK